MESHEEQIKCPECGTVQTAVVLHTFPWWSYVHECEKCKYIIMESEWDVVDVAGAVSRSSFLQYLKNLIEIHGEQMFGIYETTTETTNGDQKVTLCCWGCEAKGYMLWSESWKKHFQHEKDCEFTKLMSEVQNCL